MTLFEHSYSLFKQAIKTSTVLFKITIPIIILTRILDQLGVIEQIGHLLAPVMKVVGLPGSMGLVWATAIFTNLYGAMIVFASLAPAEGLTVAQVTVLSTMILVAHALPVELRIAQKAGTRMRSMIVLRLSGALILGIILNTIFRLSGTLQEINTVFWNPPQQNMSWFEWTLDQIKNLGYIFLVILALLLLMKILDALNVTDLLIRLLKPLLNLMGIGKDAAPITIIGMTMGIGYGGGLLIQEAQSGRLEKRDLFFSFCLMGLCHSLIEDTLLMMLIGGHAAGVLWGRMLFALAVTFILVRVFSGASQPFFDKYLTR